MITKCACFTYFISFMAVGMFFKAQPHSNKQVGAGMTDPSLWLTEGKIRDGN